MESQTNNTPEIQPEAPKKKRNLFPIILGLLVVVGGTFGITKYIHSLHHEETDDAQIDADISPVIPRVPGYVAEVRIKDNQRVKKGDTLIILDKGDFQIKLDQAEAAYTAALSSMGAAEASTSAAEANISTTQANIATVQAQIESAKINVRRTKQDYDRYSNLIKDHSITQQQFDQVEAAYQTAEKQLLILQEQKNAASRQSSAATSQSNATSKQVNVANAMIAQRKADVENAKLNLSYTVITAPADGLVSKINVQAGQYLNAGQSLFSIVVDKNTWVTANFKETQLDKMKIGQKVIVHVDAFPDHDFEAVVASFAPTTGAKFSLLPPDNASGNFIKVVQRVPVKITFTDSNDKDLPELRPGMNVDVDVHLD